MRRPWMRLDRQRLLGALHRQLNAECVDVEGQHGVAAQGVGKFGKSTDERESLQMAEKPAAGPAMESDAVNWADAEEAIAADKLEVKVLQEPAVLDEFQYRQAAPREYAAHAKRVLHPALLLLTGDRDKRVATATEDRQNKNKNADILVTVLVTGISDAAVRDALSKAGLSIKGWSKSLPIVVGMVAIEDLDKLANVAGVRRIEPTRMTRQ